jgi:hypothetical protein
LFNQGVVAVKKIVIASAVLSLAFAAPAFAKHHHKAKSHHTNSMSHKTVQPDASGQGGSGPGSDMGGTKAAPTK